MVLNSLEKRLSMRTYIDYVTFEEPKDFLLDWQKKFVINKQKQKRRVGNAHEQT